MLYYIYSIFFVFPFNSLSFLYLCNGRDGGVDFSEFVMFVIDEVVEQSYVRVCERLKLLEKKAIQRPSSTLKVQCCRRVGELKCLLVGAEGGLHIYLEDEEAVSWLTCVAKVRCNLIGFVLSNSAVLCGVVLCLLCCLSVLFVL